MYSHHGLFPGSDAQSIQNEKYVYMYILSKKNLYLPSKTPLASPAHVGDFRIHITSARCDLIAVGHARHQARPRLKGATVICGMHQLSVLYVSYIYSL